MKGQKCSNCGYKMNACESIIYNLAKIIRPKGMNASAAIGVNTVSNITKLQCPNCGMIGRWLREDE